MHGGCSCFVVVNAVSLGKSFCNVPDLVSYDLSCIVVFAFAYEFALEGALAAG